MSYKNITFIFVFLVFNSYYLKDNFIHGFFNLCIWSIILFSSEYHLERPCAPPFGNPWMSELSRPWRFIFTVSYPWWSLECAASTIYSLRSETCQTLYDADLQVNTHSTVSTGWILHIGVVANGEEEAAAPSQKSWPRPCTCYIQ